MGAFAWEADLGDPFASVPLMDTENFENRLRQIEMEVVKAVMLVIVFVVAQLSCVLPLPVTVPAFLWSPDGHGLSPHGVKEVINYQTISPKDLAKSVLNEGGWSNFVCSMESHQQTVDIAVVFVGGKLQSSDISKTKFQDQALLNLLKISFSSSNFSMAFPYVALSEENDKLESTLVSGFMENCGHGLGVNQIAYLESCSVDGKDLKKLQDLQSLQDFLGSRMENRKEGEADLVVFCNGGSEELDQHKSEALFLWAGEILSELVNTLDQSGASYSILYASDPYKSLQYPPHWAINRFLTESNSGNSSNSTTCDGVCQIKSSLLEGFFVAIVLLIILISGLCCMMGIDTPTRFETPQDS
ncbi:hypothetical protein J5N97_013608 [Dioscorea zingiberensis]|uniref:V-type proton ATPase subunit S1/VOA1 transmembrane domain-containing protein n=1 Tax=Dioscorea zingiberensis TaxID=325984 RepID=A0A9D5CSJ8_9LILI|nr:hypothetical protein J5N97_013608 [Dioscorea zingiberensis]